MHASVLFFCGDCCHAGMLESEVNRSGDLDLGADVSITVLLRCVGQSRDEAGRRIAICLSSVKKLDLSGERDCVF